MTNKFKTTGTLLSALMVAGCIGSPEEYETPPVEVQSSQGVVTCQLYTPQTVIWDRAIDWPRTMSVKEADSLCKARGALDQ